MDAAESPGRRIAKIRKSLGWTQQQLADAAKVSKSMVARVETGHVSGSTAWIGAVARALHVDVGYLTGQPYTNDSQDQAEIHQTIPAVRRALASYDLLDADDVPPSPLDELRQEVTQLGHWRRDTAYAKIGAALPSLLERLFVATEITTGDEREQAFALLANACRAANTLAHKLQYPDLSLTAMERMEWAATRAGDPLLVATTNYLRAAALSRIGDGRRALRLLNRTMVGLEPDISHDSRALAVYGSLHMKAGTIAATLADADVVHTHLEEAARAAEHTGPDTVYYETVFGPTNVKLHQLSAAVDLGKPAEAVELARTTRLPEQMAKERRAYFHIDSARAHLLANDADHAIEELYEALTTSPVHFRNSAVVRGTIHALAERQRSRKGLRELANHARIHD